MKDINNALLHIKSKHNGEIPYQYGSRECAKLMDSYAKDYHQSKLKLLDIANVVRSTIMKNKEKGKLISEHCKPCSKLCEGNCGMNYCNENGCVDNKPEIGEVKPTEHCN